MSMNVIPTAVAALSSTPPAHHTDTPAASTRETLHADYQTQCDKLLHLVWNLGHRPETFWGGVARGIREGLCTEAFRYVEAKHSTLDPSQSGDSYSETLINQLFESIVAQKRDGTVTGGAAESWTLSPDGRTYTFFLRKDAKWSDGTAITAADMVYTIFRGVSPKEASVKFVHYGTL